ncbi:HNH endonuclease [Shinella sp.]|uniref:HNH endonuclease n=1 Tax=Shinella sp. TaxID=1870904 RepID=UPI0028988261|nr:HNH endonuclease [Shinella sp.]
MGGSVTQMRLMEVLRYEPLNGEFIWLNPTGRRVRSGAKAGTIATDGYVVIRIDGRPYKAHRLAWLYMTGKWPDRFIDHIDLDKSNNKWANLREANDSQNMGNQAARSASGLKGVRKNCRKWASSIKVNGVNILLGNFDTKEEAHAAYIRAANDYFGEFARTS